MTREEQLACLTDRPCAVCKFHTEKGCNRWTCVFEEEPQSKEYSVRYRDLKPYVEEMFYDGRLAEVEIKMKYREKLEEGG